MLARPLALWQHFTDLEEDAALPIHNRMMLATISWRRQPHRQHRRGEEDHAKSKQKAKRL
eukprot:3164622-Amphidinium_carterae.1